jgi:hypothetical protein
MSDWLPVGQYLFQESERDCAIPVFGELSGRSRAAILERFPHAVNGEVKVVEWEEWLRSLGFNVTRYQPDESFTLPCAHLVERGQDAYHWIYQDARGVFDPDPSFRFMPADDPKMLSLSCYSRKILTVSVTARSDVNAGAG